MINTIVRIIEKAANISIEDGKEKYDSYFVSKTKYEQYRAAVNSKLIDDGFENVIINN